MLGSRNIVVLGFAALLSASVAFAFGPNLAEKPKASATVGYAAVAPILKGCVGCHHGAHPKHGLDLTTYSNVIKGDKEGKVVIPGKPTSSRLSKSVHRRGATPMPPIGPLPAADVARIDAWIKAGAKS